MIRNIILRRSDDYESHSLQRILLHIVGLLLLGQRNINSRLLQVLVPQDFLQRQDISPHCIMMSGHRVAKHIKARLVDPNSIKVFIKHIQWSFYRSARDPHKTVGGKFS